MSRAGMSVRSKEPRASRAALDSSPVDEGALLLAGVSAVPATLRGLFEHEKLLDAQALDEVRRTVASVEERLGRTELQVVVVGERRSGKSTLLDAIVGDRLLGGARGKLNVVTFLRRRDVPNYSARFASAKDIDFSSSVPDKTSAIDLELTTLEAALSKAQRACLSARAELGRAEQTSHRAEFDAEHALSSVEEAREVASGVSAELHGIESQAGRLERELAELELRVPRAVRTRPPGWAFWLWVLYAVFVVLRRSVWHDYRRLLGERVALLGRLAGARQRAADAAEARALAEARFEPVDLGAEQARVQSAEAERALREADAERARVRVELEELRSQREHLVSERWRRFFSDLEALSGRRDLVGLAIDYPARHLPDDVTIVDIPGMVAETSPEWALIREHADGCILASELERAVSESTKRFLRQLRDVIPHVLLVLTKMDLAYRRPVKRGVKDAWAEVEEARRIGTRRFARELGRTPQSVLSIAVAAEVALADPDSELADRFETEIAKLFVLLRRERALILGAHAGSAIRRCIANLSGAEASAERSYRERILELERKRTPEPAVFRKALLEGAEAQFPAAAAEAIEGAAHGVDEGFVLLRRLCEQSVASITKATGLAELAEQLAAELAQGAAQVRFDAYLALEGGIERAVAAIEVGLFEAMRERYQLLYEVRRTTSSSPRLGAPDDDMPSFSEVVPEVSAALARFEKTRYALGASGLLAGAATGSLLHPWLGPLVGGALGGLASFARRKSSLHAAALSLFAAALAKRQAAYVGELRSLEPAVTSAIRLALERSLERAMLRFGRFLAEPLEAEQEAIDAERGKLAALEALRDRVFNHDRELERLLEAAKRASVGLCR